MTTPVISNDLQQRISHLGEQAMPSALDDAVRLRKAKQVFQKNFNRDMAVNLEACVHCGMCAEVCHFYESTQDPQYTPVRKLDPLKQFYRREMSPLRWLHRLYTPDISLKKLNDWQPLVYDSCTECGRCDMICPMGISLSSMVMVMRQGLAAADLAPEEMRQLDQEQLNHGTQLGVGREALERVVTELKTQGVEIPVDKSSADILLLSTALDLMLFKDSLAGTAKILNKLGVNWTLRTDCFEATNSGFNSGNEEAQREASERIIDGAKNCGAKMVIIPECGHAYPALRWDAARLHGQPLPFKVMVISEFIGQEISAGRLKLKPIGKGKKVTYHDPCKIGRHGGVFDEPRQAIEALGVDFCETESHAETNYCCGGGSGVYLLKRAARLRQRAFEIKIHQVEETGADSVVTSCDTCRLNFITGAAKANWNKPVESLVELVAANLAD